MTVGGIIGGCDFFCGLSAESQQKLISMGRLAKYDKGVVIFRQGEPCPGIFVVGSGAVRISKLAPSGKEHLLHLAEPGKTFAEVAVIGGFACPANAEVLEACTCVLLPRQPFLTALEEDHALCLQLMASMAGWVRQLVGLLEDLVLRDAVGRLAHHIVSAKQTALPGEVVFPMLKKDVANHLNLTSETLSRTLRRMSQRGVIEVIEGQRIKIQDAQALEALASGLAPKI